METDKERQELQHKPINTQQILISGGWKFTPMNICIYAPKSIHEYIEPQIIKLQHANITDVLDNSIDERLDDLLEAETIDLKCSLTWYKETLKRYGVILCQDGFLNKDETLWLFQGLKAATDIIKANNGKIEKTKSKITFLIKQFDNIFVWGLFYQILILQGLCTTLERLDINKGDSGYDEAQSLYDWLVELLGKKEISFCYEFYSENDLKRLEPFCKYLLSTNVGQIVQKIINEEITETLKDEKANAQPDIITNRAKKYFSKALEAGFMTQTDNGYKWTFRNRTGAKAALSYFIMKIYSPDENAPQIIHFKALEKLFDVKRLDSTLDAMRLVKKPQQWRSEIDELFND